MFVNLFLVCMFYTLSTIRLQKRSTLTHRLTGLLSQTDLINANAITKQYKIGAAYEFLEVRRIIWRIQIILALIVAIIGYPTVLLVKWRTLLALDMG
jgi:ABC-type microcin C transport system permease subunit YejB